jgi:Tol biopolymer transport system component
MLSRFVDGRWTTPEPAPFARGYKAMDPAFSPDGNRIYFSWSAPRPGMAADTAVDYDTWVVDRAGEGWGTARHIGDAPNSAAGDFYPTITRDGTLYFDSRREIPGLPAARRIFRSRQVNGVFQPAEPLPPLINEGGASNPYIDPDERYIIYGAGRPGGFGAGDLYVSWRTADGGWTTPQNLGPRVNSAAGEFCPMVSPDGRWLYFSRIPFVNRGAQSNQIWVVSIDVLPQPPR